MEPDQQSPSGDQPWQRALDPRLLRRLLDTHVRPGVIAPDVGGAILARMQQASTGLPLLTSLAGRLSSAEDSGASRTPIVYAQPAPPAVIQAEVAAQPAREAVRRPVVQATRVQRAADPAATTSAAGGAPAERSIVSIAPAHPVSMPSPRPAAPAVEQAVLPRLPAAAQADSPAMPATAATSSRIVLPPGRLRTADAASQPVAPRASPAAAPVIQRAVEGSPASQTAQAADRAGVPADLPHPRSSAAPPAGSAAAIITGVSDDRGGRSAVSSPLALVRPLEPRAPTHARPSRPNVVAIQRQPDPSAPSPVRPVVAPLSAAAIQSVPALAPAAPTARPVVAPLGAALMHGGQASQAAPNRPVVAPAQPPSPPVAPAPMLLPSPAAGPTAVLDAPADGAAGTSIESDASAPPALALPIMMAGGPAPSVDTVQVAAQVYELLVRRLARERERRGW
jgi:hypothetical protein